MHCPLWDRFGRIYLYLHKRVPNSKWLFAVFWRKIPDSLHLSPGYSDIRRHSKRVNNAHVITICPESISSWSSRAIGFKLSATRRDFVHANEAPNTA